MTKVNFTAQSAKSLKVKATTEHKGLNAARRSIVSVWNGANDKELQASLEAAKADGLSLDDFTGAYIIEHLEGTNWVKGGVIGATKKGVFAAKTTWTPGQLVDYVRRANRARLEKKGE